MPLPFFMCSHHQFLRYSILFRAHCCTLCRSLIRLPYVGEFFPTRTESTERSTEHFAEYRPHLQPSLVPTLPARVMTSSFSWGKQPGLQASPCNRLCRYVCPVGFQSGNLAQNQHVFRPGCAERAAVLFNYVYLSASPNVAHLTNAPNYPRLSENTTNASAVPARANPRPRRAA